MGSDALIQLASDMCGAQQRGIVAVDVECAVAYRDRELERDVAG